MREIMCFGDSNTWGYDPARGARFAREVRWTGVLQASLGPGIHVIEEGLNGRTSVWEDPVEGDKMGRRHLMPCLESQAPLDLVVLMLGACVRYRCRYRRAPCRHRAERLRHGGEGAARASPFAPAAREAHDVR